VATVPELVKSPSRRNLPATADAFSQFDRRPDSSKFALELNSERLERLRYTGPKPESAADFSGGIVFPGEIVCDFPVSAARQAAKMSSNTCRQLSPVSGTAPRPGRRLMTAPYFSADYFVVAARRIGHPPGQRC
jgi:hypothetical protein